MRFTSKIAALTTFLAAIGSAANGSAQGRGSGTAPAPEVDRVVAEAQTQSPAELVKVDVVILREQAGKPTVQLPYSLVVAANNANSSASLRIGVETNVGETVNKFVGTSIDVVWQGGNGGRHRIRVNLEDSAIYPSTPQDPVPFGTVRMLKVAHSLTLVDGQTVDFSLGTDRNTGEVVKATVTLRVMR